MFGVLFPRSAVLSPSVRRQVPRPVRICPTVPRGDNHAALEHDDAILSVRDGEALMSAFQLVMQLIAQNQTVCTIVYREVRTPAETPNKPVKDQGSESCAERINKESHVEVIQEAFATCLGMKVGNVGSHTSFFDELGGSSADAVRLVWLLKEKGVIGVDLRQVLLARTPAALGRVMRC